MIYLPEKDIHQIGTFIHTNESDKLVICLCADWCNNCSEWKKDFAFLSERYSNDLFIWLDIEQHADMVSSIDLDILPVLLVQCNQDVSFLGAISTKIEAVIPILNAEGSVMSAYDPGIRQFLLEDFNHPKERIADH